MERIGPILKAARERRQMTIAQVVAATKMKPLFITALENDEFHVLFAPVYARGFIRLYAECVGLNPDALLLRMEGDSKTADARKSRAIARPYAQPPPHVQPVAADPTEEDPTRTESTSPPHPRGSEEDSFGARIRSLVHRCPVSALPKPPANARPPDRPQRWKKPPHNPVAIWLNTAKGIGILLVLIAVILIWNVVWKNVTGLPDACRWIQDPPAPYLERNNAVE